MCRARFSFRIVEVTKTEPVVGSLLDKLRTCCWLAAYRGMILSVWDGDLFLEKKKDLENRKSEYMFTLFGGQANPRMGHARSHFPWTGRENSGFLWDESSKWAPEMTGRRGSNPTNLPQLAVQISTWPLFLQFRWSLEDVRRNYWMISPMWGCRFFVLFWGAAYGAVFLYF